MNSGNTFGDKFKLQVSGNSHDREMELKIFGMPRGITIDYDLINNDLLRRRPKYIFDTPRVEADKFKIVQGIENDITNGETIIIKLENKRYDNSHYEQYSDIYRPSHADYTWEMKYGKPLPPGGGTASARETVLRVIAGAFAKMYLNTYFDNKIKIKTWTYSVGHLVQEEFSTELNTTFIDYLTAIRSEGDSIGGSVRCVIEGVPPGIGAPPFDKTQAYFAFAMMTIPAVKAFEIGRGVQAANMKGSEHNDPYYYDDSQNKIRPFKNDAGGVLGGITTGEEIIMTISFKPIPSIYKTQSTVNKKGEICSLQITGNHDVCSAVRGAVVVEAMAAIVLVNLLLNGNFI